MKRSSFAEVASLTDAYAHALREHGVKEGMRVLLMVTPGLEFVATSFAVYKLGAVLVLIDPGMGVKNFLACSKEVGAEALIGIPKATYLRNIFRNPFKTVKKTFTVKKKWYNVGKDLDKLARKHLSSGVFECVKTTSASPAAILFTSGSTGVAKGVEYTHGMFVAQTQAIQHEYNVTSSDIDLPAFPPFGLFSLILGATIVIPDMDPSRPANVNPERIIEAVNEHKVTYSFGSPAIWRRVGAYCEAKNIKLNSMTRLMMAGAPIPPELVNQWHDILGGLGDVFTPYGATESLPVASISGHEIISYAAEKTNAGAGFCVGKPICNTEVRIIRITDEPIYQWDANLELPKGEVGEIIVRSKVVTRHYFKRPKNDAMSKIEEGDTFWHRIGDAGYIDENGYVWFCGRKDQRVETQWGVMFTVCCEAIFNQHPMVYRSALVPLAERSEQRPVVIIELMPEYKHFDRRERGRLRRELLDIAAENPVTKHICKMYFHPDFPVDVRHNAKIKREVLASWLARRQECR